MFKVLSDSGKVPLAAEVVQKSALSRLPHKTVDWLIIVYIHVIMPRCACAEGIR